HVFCFSIIIVGEEFREGFVGKVSYAAHDPLFDRPGIGAAAQHFEIVVRFQNQHITAPQVIANTGRHVAQIGGKTNFYTFGTKSETYRVGGIVRNGKWGNRDIANLKTSSCRKGFQLFELWAFAVLITYGARPGLVGGARHEDRNPGFPRQHSYSI